MCSIMKPRFNIKFDNELLPVLLWHIKGININICYFAIANLWNDNGTQKNNFYSLHGQI